MVQHQIDDHAGYGNIEPERQCPACDSSMSYEVMSRSSVECHQHKRHDGDCQNDMSDKNDEIEGTDYSLP